MLVYYMLSRGTHPYQADTDSEVEQNILDDNPNLSSLDDSVAVDLVQSMLAPAPSDRPSVKSLLR